MRIRATCNAWHRDFLFFELRDGPSGGLTWTRTEPERIGRSPGRAVIAVSSVEELAVAAPDLDHVDGFEDEGVAHRSIDKSVKRS